MIEVYCDGSCRNNGYSNSAGGWCFAIIRDKEKLDISFSGAAENTTNNRMELMAFIRAAQYVKENKLGPATYYIDSAYVVNAFNQNWLQNWIANDWINSSKKPVKNQDLWKELLIALDGEFYTIKKVKGHQGNGNWNDYVDKEAVKASIWLKENK